jgi:hypothetical protein
MRIAVPATEPMVKDQPIATSWRPPGDQRGDFRALRLSFR